MRTETYKTKMGATRYRPIMTECEFRQADDDCNGFCLACGMEQLGGCEPDARGYACEACEEPKVYGYSELLIMGIVRIEDEASSAGNALQAHRKTRRGGRMPKCFCGQCSACKRRKWRAKKKQEFATKLIAEKFNKSNRQQLWALRDYHGYSNLEHTFCHQTGRLERVTAEHADRLMEAGQNIYVDVPCDPNGPEGPWKR